jgi:hypothetical protein
MAFAPPISPVKSGRQNRRWIPAVLMAALFLSGGAIGAGLAAIAIHSQRETLFNRDKLPDLILLMIQDDLGINLTPDQMQQVKTILEKRQESLRTLRLEVRPRFDHEYELLDSQVSAVLDPSQRDKWHDSFREKMLVWFPWRTATPAAPAK